MQLLACLLSGAAVLLSGSPRASSKPQKYHYINHFALVSYRQCKTAHLTQQQYFEHHATKSEAWAGSATSSKAGGIGKTFRHPLLDWINESVPDSGTAREQAPQGHKLPVVFPSPWCPVPGPMRKAVEPLHPSGLLHGSARALSPTAHTPDRPIPC
jgi:hypothetical protein